MENNCVIKIESRIETGDSVETVEAKEEGLLLSRNGSWYISYMQEGVPVRIKLAKDGSAHIIRGKADNRLILVPNQQTDCSYNTDYFPIDLKLFTTKVQHDLSEAGGTVRLHYSIIHSEDEIHHFKIKLCITEVTK